MDWPSIDYMKGNSTLWKPLERLRSELELRSLVAVEMEQQQQYWQENLPGVDQWWSDQLWESF